MNKPANIHNWDKIHLFIFILVRVEVRNGNAGHKVMFLEGVRKSEIHEDSNTDTGRSPLYIYLKLLCDNVRYTNKI